MTEWPNVSPPFERMTPGGAGANVAGGVVDGVAFGVVDGVAFGVVADGVVADAVVGAGVGEMFMVDPFELMILFFKKKHNLANN